MHLPIIHATTSDGQPFFPASPSSSLSRRNSPGNHSKEASAGVRFNGVLRCRLLRRIAVSTGRKAGLCSRSWKSLLGAFFLEENGGRHPSANVWPSDVPFLPVLGGKDATVVLVLSDVSVIGTGIANIVDWE